MLSIGITGGCGFIGTNLVLELKKNHPNVYLFVMNRISSERTKYNIRYLKDQLQYQMPVLYIGDIQDRPWMENIFQKEKPDFIIHLAANAGVRISMKKPFDCIGSNVNGTLNLLEIIKKLSKKPKLIFASSSTIHSDPVLSVYAATKKMGEDLCSSYHHVYDLDILCLRFFSVYGPLCRDDLLIGKILKCITTPEQCSTIEVYGSGHDIKRDFTYIHDTTRAITNSLFISWKGYHCIDVGTGVNYSIMEIIEFFRPYLSSHIVIKHIEAFREDQPESRANTDYAHRIIGFKAKFSMKDSLDHLFSDPKLL